MAKKAKPSVDKIVKKVNKEFEKTSSQIEGLISDALKQFDSLQHQIQEPVRKLLKEVDELRDREMKRFNEEFERRLGEFQELQNTILERIGMASEKAGKEPPKTKKAKASPVAKKAPAAKAPGPKNSTKPKPAARTKKPVDKTDLTLIKGIGPATAKKMKEAGITSIDQIANPSAADKEKLKAFSSVKGFSQFTAEAKKII